MAKLGRILPAGALALIAAVFAVEGGFVDDQRDPGGATNHGITEKVARANGYTGSMADLSEEFAAEIYFEDYIERPGFVAVLEHSVPTAEELVDSGVNAGPGRAARWLQESLNHLNNRGMDYPDVAVDGRIGPGTRAAYAALRRRRGEQLACVLLIRLMDAKQAQHYAALGGTNAWGESFMVGWVRTRVGNVPTSRCPGRPA